MLILALVFACLSLALSLATLTFFYREYRALSAAVLDSLTVDHAEKVHEAVKKAQEAISTALAGDSDDLQAELVAMEERAVFLTDRDEFDLEEAKKLEGVKMEYE